MRETGLAMSCCFECRFYQHDAPPQLLKTDLPSTPGECRRHAPRPSRHWAKSADWPQVFPSHWCGEFQPRDGSC